MQIIGCDYHPGFQQIAFVDTETGELQERRVQHREEAEKFYRDLAAQGMKVRVGMEASGHARWFERLLSELQFELWIGDAAEISARRVRKQKTDRQDAQLILKLMLKDDFPQYERDYGVHMLLVSQKQLKLMLRLQFFDHGGTTPVMRAYAIS